MAVAKKKQEGLSRRASGPLSKPVSTLTVGALEAALLAEVPASDAEGWDRTGMTVGDPARLVEGVAVALDPTVDAVREAASRGANVLLTHHPAYLEAPDAFGPASSVAANPRRRGVGGRRGRRGADRAAHGARREPARGARAARHAEAGVQGPGARARGGVASQGLRGSCARCVPRTTRSRWGAWLRAARRCSPARHACGATSRASWIAWSPARARRATWRTNACAPKRTAWCAAR